MFGKQVAAFAIVALCVLAAGSSAQASVVFDDAMKSGWGLDIGQTQQDNVRSGTGLITGVSWDLNNPQIDFDHTGSLIGTDTILEFYANSTIDGAAANVAVKINGLEFQPNGGGIYYVDGVQHTGAFTTDTDSSTWQKVTFDVTQTRYAWVDPIGYQPFGLTPADSLTNINFKNENGATKFLADDIQLTAVPEPATMGILGVAALGLLLRRRA